MIVLIMLNYWLQSSGFLFVVVICYYFSNCLFTIFEWLIPGTGTSA